MCLVAQYVERRISRNEPLNRSAFEASRLESPARVGFRFLYNTYICLYVNVYIYIDTGIHYIYIPIYI